MGKIAERAFLHAVSVFCIDNAVIPNEQFGFRAKHSALQAALKSLKAGRETGAVFLDISKAVNQVWHNGLLYKGFPDDLLKFLQSFLEGRSFQVKHKGILSSKKFITSGVPQGFPLAPLLFNIYLTDLKVLRRLKVQAAFYADDSAFYACSYDEDNIVKKLKKQLDVTAAWFELW